MTAKKEHGPERIIACGCSIRCLSWSRPKRPSFPRNQAASVEFDPPMNGALGRPPCLTGI